MTPFATFAVLYMTALFLELAEKWTYPLFTFATLLLLLIIVATRITRITFLIFLALGAANPMTFEYQGRLYETEDIAKDPVWRTDRRDWEMALMDFRVIQLDGANRCRW
ncbi:MAG TPA: hypothetical protein VFS51_07995 [Gemmatimonadales bacterium]|nr:hypothetical protein [Gemmatimonadales bacterium]